ncbi:major tail protein [Arthrobacter phage Qui]|uniref:Major tail protein n=1 Tax=Arthrobacter phage Qui TaxID=2603260 RepID=A0A5B8WGV4_9CAUD|nr:major tail protein [Arthrobacter phage Qui]QED11521.1 major tail protein [Arthrobacter phage Qui]QOC56353.1 major tail protein [Arthrobacter phage Paella]
MTKLKWDQVGEKFYETGVDQGVLYLPNTTGIYDKGYAWNGLVSVSESPSGAESNKQYADNTVYLNLVSAEEFSATVEAFTYPEEFAECDGTAVPTAGVYVGQQRRKSFGLSYRTRVGNDIDAADHGYKLHLIYGALAAPTEKAYTTINDSPEAITFSWELSTTPVEVGSGLKPTATLTIDSTKVSAAKLTDLENLLYGTAGVDPQLPTPAAVIAMFNGSLIEVTTVTAPTYNSTTHVITIPTTTGVEYFVDGVKKTGTVTITKDTVVTAAPADGYKFPLVTDDDWYFDFV